MLSRATEKKWIQQIDSIISVFPQQIISEIIVDFLVINFSFDCTVLPCNTHEIKHSKFEVQNYINVTPYQLNVKQYSNGWIYVPLLPEVDLQERSDLFLEVLGVGTWRLRLCKNLRNYHTLLACGFNSSVTRSMVLDLLPGKYIMSLYPNFDYDKIRITRVNYNFEIISSEYHYLDRVRCNTLLIGVGYYPQSVEILSCPPKKHAIWDQIEKWPWAYGRLKIDNQITDGEICQKCDNGL